MRCGSVESSTLGQTLYHSSRNLFTNLCTALYVADISEIIDELGAVGLVRYICGDVLRHSYEYSAFASLT